jgi:hypothetical protein
VLLCDRVLQRSADGDAEDTRLVGDAGVGAESWLVGLDHAPSSEESYGDCREKSGERLIYQYCVSELTEILGVRYKSGVRS